MVEVSLTVGKLDASLALLLTKEHHLIEFPTILLPKDVQAGSIVKISCERDEPMETKDSEFFMDIQDQIMQTFGTMSPKAPALRVRNVTETSAVLEWDPIEAATADVISLTLYKNGSRFGVIPSPLTRTAIKLSGLAIDTPYTFYLVLATTAGTYNSEELTVKTHKMTDLTGITLCIGTIEGTDIDRTDLEETIKNIGAKPLQDSVKLDTTHFVCTIGEGAQWKRALNLNIPVVRPEWIKACESERRLVSVRAYYLNADPKLRPPAQRSRAASQATDVSSESTGHKRAVSEIADSPFKTPSVPLTQNNTPEPVPEGQEPEEEIVPRPDISRSTNGSTEPKSEEVPVSTTPPTEPIESEITETENVHEEAAEKPVIPTLSVTEHVDEEPIQNGNDLEHVSEPLESTSETVDKDVKEVQETASDSSQKQPIENSGDISEQTETSTFAPETSLEAPEESKVELAEPVQKDDHVSAESEVAVDNSSLAQDAINDLTEEKTGEPIKEIDETEVIETTTKAVTPSDTQGKKNRNKNKKKKSKETIDSTDNVMEEVPL